METFKFVDPMMIKKLHILLYIHSDTWCCILAGIRNELSFNIQPAILFGKRLLFYQGSTLNNNHSLIFFFKKCILW